MRIKKIFKIIAGISMLLASIAVCFSIAFFLTLYIYRNTGINPPELLEQIINLFLGLFLTIFIIIIFRFKGIRRGRGTFESVITAIEKIAKGDFNVRLDYNLETQHHPFDELVKSVNKMALDLGEMEKMRQEFISNVSHEIHSPLTSIRGFAQALQNNQLNLQDKVHYLNIIESESLRLSKLSDNLLKLASLESENIKFEPKLYRMDKQLRDIILTCEPQWSGKGIDMEVNLGEQYIKADEDLMSQVWVNLIHNSIKFTPKGGTVKAELHTHGNKVCFSISDTGIGITQEDQIHIFERFYKADKSRERSNRGSGLGLSIVKKIVDMHHGTIDVESKLGEGTTFTVALPID